MDRSIFGEVTTWGSERKVDDLNISIDGVSSEGTGVCDGGEVTTMVQVGKVFFVPVFGVVGKKVKGGVVDVWMLLQLSNLRERRENSMKWGEFRRGTLGFEVVF